MKKLSVLLACALTITLAGGLRAQKQTLPSHRRGATHQTAPKPGHNVSYTGPVKGMPTGKTFVLALRKGPVTVDATNAQIRSKSGPGTFDMIKGGAFVTVVGPMNGTTLQAKTVTISRLAGEKVVKRGKRHGMTGTMAPKK